MIQAITFGQWLKSRRRVLDLTQQALAERVSCSAELIYRIEAGQRRPSAQIAALMGQVLNVPDAELEAFVRFARADSPIKLHTPQVELTPWRDAFVPSNNLPLQLTPLIGREAVVAEALSRLRQDDVRLLSLIGPPGIGKTRLAIQLGNDALLDFPDGVFFVELASITQPDRVILEIAHTLAISLTTHKRPAHSLHAYLFERRMLLILDNVEQLLDAASDIHALLAACPLLKIVVTSRIPLRLRGEHQFPVQALALPGHIDDLNLSGIASYAAVQLFMQRAQSVRPDVELTAANAPVIAAICARLDGLPLAIEIVAAQIAALLPEEILQHLTGRSLLESVGSVDSDPRHHSLSAAIRWSYQHLNEAEQIFFCRLGVFADGCTLEAAGAVCQPSHEVVLSLSKLVSMNLVRRETGAQGASRYHLLEVIRQFAGQELEARDEWQVLRERHADYFYHFALDNEDSLRTGGQSAGLERFEREHHNLQAALDHFMAVSAWRQGLALVSALVEFWIYRNHILVGLRYATAFLEATADHPTLEAERVHVLNGAAVMSYFAGDFAAVGAYASQAQALAERVNSPRDRAWALITLGMQSGGMGDFDAAIRWFEQGQAAIQHVDLPWEAASLLNGLGEVMRSQGRYDQALAYYAPALAAAEGMGNLWLCAHIHDNIGHTAYAQGDYAMAHDHARRSLSASIALGDERGIAMSLEKLGGIAVARGQLERAARLLGAAEALRKARNTPIEGMDAADYQQIVADLRQALAPDALDAAWHEGRRMPLAQIIEQALEA